MKKIIMSFVALTLLLGSCQTNPELTDSEKEQIVKSVQEVSDELYNAFNQVINEETVANNLLFYSEDVDLQWQTKPVIAVYNSSIMANTNDDMEKLLNSIFSSRISNNAVVKERSYSVLSEDKVLEVIKMDFTAMFKDSTTFGPTQMMNSIIWTNEDETWKVMFFHQSDNGN